MDEVRYPDLSGARCISFDTETKDPNLTTLGPGQYRKDGHILGVSIATPDGFKEYYNVGHYDVDADERIKNVNYLRATLGNNVPKLGQSIIYDVDWLENGEHKIKVGGELGSIEIAEALLDETQEQYNMEFMGQKYLGRGKVKSEPEKFCEARGWKGDFRQYLWRMPYSVVRPYGAGDAELPIAIFDIQRPMLEEQELLDLYKLENRLTRVLVKMRKTGTLIDADKRDRNGLMIQNRIEEAEHRLFSLFGEFNYMSTMQVAKIFDKQGIRYPLTERGNPSIDSYFYKRYKDEIPLVKELFELRQMKHHLNTFIMGSHLRFVCPDGLIHPQFFNMRNDNLGALKGTRSGRLSGANPNLQQQPSKGVDEYWGQVCREDFIPFPDCWWGKIDYSQIEYRFMAHFAVGEGAEELRRSYNENAEQDYHQYIMDLTGLKRRYAKNLNFGVAFGMGAQHMAELFGWDVEYAYEVLNVYHSRAPYIRSTISLVEQKARQRGYIKTFLKRRSHLKDPRKAYTMYCRLVQGSAADLMKAAMVKADEDGLFEVLYPHATVHDELDVSIPKTRAGLEAFQELQHVMESVLKLRVPVRAEPEVGPNWADVEPVVKTEEEKARNKAKAEAKGEKDGTRTWDELYKEVV
jgi:DNA polymerase I-like protein with 3'-5' exonuclease and polymerase domains